LAWTRAELRIRAREQLGDLTPAHLSKAAEAAKQALKMQAAARLFERSAAEARNQDDFLGASSALLEAAECLRWLAEHDRQCALLDEVDALLARDGLLPAARVKELQSRLLSERSWLELGRGQMARAEELARAALDKAPRDALAARFTA